MERHTAAGRITHMSDDGNSRPPPSPFGYCSTGSHRPSGKPSARDSPAPVFLLRDRRNRSLSVVWRHVWVEHGSSCHGGRFVFFPMLVYQRTPDATIALAALPVLAAALLMNGAFRWISLIRTWMISILLFAIYQYLVLFFISGPFPPQLLVFTLYFLVLLLSAWIGCLPSQNAASTAISKDRLA